MCYVEEQGLSILFLFILEILLYIRQRTNKRKDFPIVNDSTKIHNRTISAFIGCQYIGGNDIRGR